MIKPKKNLSDQRRMYYHQTEICFKSCITAKINTTHFCTKTDNGNIREKIEFSLIGLYFRNEEKNVYP